MRLTDLPAISYRGMLQRLEIGYDAALSPGLMISHATSLVLIALALLLIAVASLCVYRLVLHPLAKYPGPRLAALSDWYTAFYAARGDLHIQLHQWHAQYGPALRIGPNFITFDGADEYKEVYGHRANGSKNSRYATSGASRAPSAITDIDRPVVEFKRSAHKRQWTDSNLKQLEIRMLRIIATFHDVVAGKPEAFTGSDAKDQAWSVACDLSDTSIHLVTDMALECTFGENPDLLGDAQNRRIVPAFVTVIWRIMACSIQPKIQEWHLDKLLLAPAYKSIIGVGTWTLERTRRRRARGNAAHIAKGADFVKTMLETTDPKNGLCFKTKDLWLEAYLMLGVGVATTGPTLASTFFYLLHYPTALDRATTEITTTFADIDEIVLGPRLESYIYLQACIDETLRMVPVLSNPLPREVQPGGTVVSGNFFEPGTILGGSLYPLQRNERYFRHAHSYKPERWLASDNDGLKPSREAWCPFSTGPRTCVGQKLALAMLRLTVARTMFLYDVRLAPDAPYCGGRPGAQKCTDRTYKSYVGYTAEGPLAQFRARQ